MSAVARLSSPMTARLVTLLPEPDSPTTPSVSPRRRVKESSETARTIPSRVRKRTERSRTSRRIELSATLRVAYAWVEEGVDNVDNEVHQRHRGRGADDNAEHCRQILRDCAVEGKPAEALEVEDGLGDDRAPDQQRDVEAE